MFDTNANSTQSSNFNLKTQYSDLHGRGIAKSLSIKQLEALRAEGSTVPASKHGLEVICGASCETGAQ